MTSFYITFDKVTLHLIYPDNRPIRIIIPKMETFGSLY